MGDLRPRGSAREALYCYTDTRAARERLSAASGYREVRSADCKGCDAHVQRRDVLRWPCTSFLDLDVPGTVDMIAVCEDGEDDYR